LDETPWSEVVGRLHDALRAAADDGEPLIVAVSDDGPDEESPEAVLRDVAGSALSADPTRAVPTH
jgi:hypothetical protein